MNTNTAMIYTGMKPINQPNQPGIAGKVVAVTGTINVCWPDGPSTTTCKAQCPATVISAVPWTPPGTCESGLTLSLIGVAERFPSTRIVPFLLLGVPSGIEVT